MTAFLAGFSRADGVCAAFGADLRSPLFQAITAKRLLERRAEEACLLDLGVQVRDRLGVIALHWMAAFGAYIPVIRVVPSALRTFDRIDELRLLVATLTPRTASSAIRHPGLLSTHRLRG